MSNVEFLVLVVLLVYMRGIYMALYIIKGDKDKILKLKIERLIWHIIMN